MDDLLQEMIDPAPEPGDRPRRRRLIATVAIIGLAVVGIASLTTGAIFTDREQTSAGFTTGTVDLSLAGPASVHVDATGLAPGDSYAAPVQVTNVGSLALRYAVTYTATRNDPAVTTDTGTVIADDATGSGRADLRDWMKLDVWAVGSSSASCTTSPTGTLLSTESTLATTGLETPLVGDKAEGQQSGAHGAQDADRTIGAGTSGSEWLCFVVTMNRDAGNTLQNTGVDLAFDFYAEQTANNP